MICAIITPASRYNERNLFIQIDKYQCYPCKDLKATSPLAVNSLRFIAIGKPKIALFFDDENLMEVLYLDILEKQGYLKDLMA